MIPRPMKPTDFSGFAMARTLAPITHDPEPENFRDPGFFLAAASGASTCPGHLVGDAGAQAACGPIALQVAELSTHHARHARHGPGRADEILENLRHAGIRRKAARAEVLTGLAYAALHSGAHPGKTGPRAIPGAHVPGLAPVGVATIGAPVPLTVPSALAARAGHPHRPSTEAARAGGTGTASGASPGARGSSAGRIRLTATAPLPQAPARTTGRASVEAVSGRRSIFTATTTTTALADEEDSKYPATEQREGSGTRTG